MLGVPSAAPQHSKPAALQNRLGLFPSAITPHLGVPLMAEGRPSGVLADRWHPCACPHQGAAGRGGGVPKGPCVREALRAFPD